MKALLLCSTPDTAEQRLADRLAAAMGPRGHRLTVAAASDDAEHRRVLGRDALTEVDLLVTLTPESLTAAARFTDESLPVLHVSTRAVTDPAQRDELTQALPRAARLAATSRALADDLDVLAPRAGVDVTVLPPVPVESTGFRPRSTLDTGLVVAVDRGLPLRTLRRLVNAFGEVAADLPGWRLRLVGTGSDRPDLVRTVRKLELFDRIELLEPTEDLREEWALASIAVHLAGGADALHDLLDSGAAGVPAIALDTPDGATDLLDPGTGLLVPPASVTAMSTALLALARDAGVRRRMGAAAAVRSGQWHGEDVLSRWEQVLQGSGGRSTRTTASGRTRPPAGITAAGRTAVQAPVQTPAEATAYALTAAVRAADRASSRWFVIPADDAQPVRLALPAGDLDDFLTALTDAAPDLDLERAGDESWPRSSGPVTEQAARLRGSRPALLHLAVHPTDPNDPGLLDGCGIDVECWDGTPTSGLRAPRRNRYGTNVPSDQAFTATTVEGVACRTLPLMARPTTYDCTFPVDVVYTWVDGSDPVWARAREDALRALTGTATTRESSGLARFTSRDELRYSMRSVHLFAPWVRTIHLVTAGQRPSWLADHPRVRVVDHREILPASALPTFNSHAIETALHRVPGLSEQWIYLNDDVFLGRPLRPERFFTGAGQPRVFPSDWGIGDPGSVPEIKPWHRAAWNNRALLEESFGVINPTAMRHTPHPQRTSVLEKLEQRFADAFARTSHAAFRSDTDISPLSSLAQHYGLATGDAVVGELDEVFVDISAPDVLGRLDRILRRDLDAFCLGDHHQHALPPHRLHSVLAEFFERYFPVTAPWERE